MLSVLVEQCKAKGKGRGRGMGWITIFSVSIMFLVFSLLNISVADAYDPSPVDDDTILLGGQSADDKIPLILIHGIHGNRQFGDDVIASPNLLYWESFSSQFHLSSLRQKYTIHRFHYVSDKWNVSALGYALGRKIEQLIAPGKKFVILAHSMGGWLHEPT